MSKGLGTLQRRLIEISTATQTIWEAMPDGIRIEVADTKEKTACGITTQAKEGYKWRKTGEPWYCAETVIRSLEELVALKSVFPSVCLFHNRPTDSMLAACWSMHHIRATLWPELWKQGDNRVDLPWKRCSYATFPQIPPDIKKARNAAQAGLSRAVASLEKRSMITYAGWTSSDAANVIWKNHGGSGANYQHKGHSVYMILDSKLTAP